MGWFWAPEAVEMTARRVGGLFPGKELLYFLLPLFWLVVASTKSNADLFSSFGL
jgi:ABC-type glycerol-3-phosphate transport system permease component